MAEARRSGRVGGGELVGKRPSTEKRACTDAGVRTGHTGSHEMGLNKRQEEAPRGRSAVKGSAAFQKKKRRRPSALIFS